MPLVTTKEMFAKAYNGGYAIGAFNVNNMEIVQGITEAAAEVHSPLILQVSAGARKYAKHVYLMKLIEAAVEDTGLPICVHLDHGADYDICKSCVDGGFSSVMIDGSSRSFEENIAVTKKVVEYAHDHDVVVEGELGRLEGVEDDVKVSAADSPWPSPSAPATGPISSSPARSPSCASISWRKSPGVCPASPLCSTAPAASCRNMWRWSTASAAACRMRWASRRICSGRLPPWPSARSTSIPTCAWASPPPCASTWRRILPTSILGST